MALSPSTRRREVVEAFGGANEPLATILTTAIVHLYRFVVESGLTRNEWAAGVDFPTRSGQTCDDRRQECILLSDVLAVSRLVEMINQGGRTSWTMEPPASRS